MRNYAASIILHCPALTLPDDFGSYHSLDYYREHGFDDHKEHNLDKAAEYIFNELAEHIFDDRVNSIFYDYAEHYRDHRLVKKNREPEPEPTGNYQPGLSLVPPISPSSPLMTPSPSYLGRDGAPLTPPPRLQERPLLPSASSEQLVERASSRLRQGFHLPTGSRANLSSPYGSAVSPAFAMAAVVTGERQPSAPQSANRVGTPYVSPTRSQFTTISYASSLADPGPPPDRELPTTPARVATAHSRSRSRPDVSPNAIGVALAFPPQDDGLSAQVSNESGQSSESKIMTGPMRGSWGENRVVSVSEEAPAQLAPRTQTTRRTSRSPILEEQELARMAGSY
ncbi:hypothetical protein MY1884_008608 [Beauveria asiatica]